MQIPSTDTAKTKEEKLNRKRNLFGLGITSLIAACADGAGGGGTDLLLFKAEKLEKLKEAKGIDYAATLGGGTDSLTVEVEKPEKPDATLTFSDGSKGGANADIYQLTTDTSKYDLVISAPIIDKDQSGSEYAKGRIFIYWDVAKVTDKDSPHLEIKGATRTDQIGILRPEFFHLGGATDGGYDIVFASRHVADGNGAIYVLWDVAKYESDDPHTVSFGELNTATNADHGLLIISGTNSASKSIGIHAPEFFHLGGATEGGYDMVIRAPRAGTTSASSEGAVYVLWDVKSYYSTGETTFFNLGDDGLEKVTAGLLSIYGTRIADQIGIHAPEFFHLGGATEGGYDMVIRSHEVDKSDSSLPFIDNQGAIYVLWDVADYYQDASGKIANKRIDLDKLGDTDSMGQSATAGLLTILGAIKEDQIGIHAPEFLQIAGKDNNYDMVIRSHEVDKGGAGGANDTDAGAIYVLWDVADYANQNVSIDLATPADDSSGLLTIYGREATALLGDGSKNILYDTDGELTNIDKDTANGGTGTKDIAFRDKDYTYILFGDKVAEVESVKVKSKTIDLSTISSLTDKSGALNASKGFFGYNFDPSGLGSATASTSAEDRVGYRFATGTGSGSDGNGGYKTLAEVQTAYSNATLSDKDADLGVWDIA